MKTDKEIETFLYNYIGEHFPYNLTETEMEEYGCYSEYDMEEEREKIIVYFNDFKKFLES